MSRSGQRVLIIGATSAIAEAVARRWARQGYRLFLAARDQAHVTRIASDLALRGAEQTEVANFDAQDTVDHGPLVERACAALGGLDIALIAHGTLPDQRACEASAEQALAAWQVNAMSTLSLITVLANRMEAQGHGTLAVITSVAGDRGRPTNYVYGAAKAAVSTCCEGLRARLLHAGVRVVDIRPGIIRTPMTAGLALPDRLASTPEAIAPRLVAGIEAGRAVVYAPARWALIMWVIRWLPRALFNRMRL
jgi:short-subunit dehydrogenase